MTLMHSETKWGGLVPGLQEQGIERASQKPKVVCDTACTRGCNPVNCHDLVYCGSMLYHDLRIVSFFLGLGSPWSPEKH